MDHFGIGAAMRALLQVYSRSAKNTGRTTSLVNSVKDGDRIVFNLQDAARHFEHLCRERGVKVECILVDPRDPGRLFDRPTSAGEGRTIFDHSWVEAYYLQAIERAAKEIDELERESSGYGAAHRETRRRAEEIYRWGGS